MSTCRNGGKVHDEPIFVTVRREFADEISALAALVDEGLIAMRHVSDRCGCEGTWRLSAACVLLTLGRRNGSDTMTTYSAGTLPAAEGLP